MKKILIVEDDQFSLELLVQLLNGKYEVMTALDGESAVHKVREYQPDLVLLDISLPLMDGYQVAKKIKMDPQINKIYIIGISSRAMKKDIDKAINIGFDEYLTKPLDESQLFEKLDKYLKDD